MTRVFILYGADCIHFFFFFFFQAEDGIRDRTVTGVQTCALPISSNANPERHGDLRPVSGVWGAARESARSRRRFGAQWASRDGAYGRLGLRKTRGRDRREEPSGTISIRLAAPGKRCRGDLPSDLAALPASKLEPGGAAVLPGAAGTIRRRAHFWAVRSARSGGSRGLPQPRDAVRRRANRNVSSDRAEFVAKA